MVADEQIVSVKGNRFGLSLEAKAHQIDVLHLTARAKVNDCKRAFAFVSVQMIDVSPFNGCALPHSGDGDSYAFLNIFYRTDVNILLVEGGDSHLRVASSVRTVVVNP